MVQVDMTRPGRELRPGIDLWKTTKCESVRSRAGDQMLKLTLERVSNPQERVFDNIMLEGGGWEIGKRKLAAFVPADFKGDLDPLELVCIRVWVCTAVDTYQGKDKLAVSIDELKCAGYQRVEDVPPGCSVPEVEDEDMSAPF